MTNPHDEMTGFQIDPNALAVNCESAVTRLLGDVDETDSSYSVRHVEPDRL
ncbi:MAG: hypothetical protein H0V48_06230 [Nocardioidaceae bacterium]|jgi:hypothetical protein|nr:hypothetical protein [Nocardioidaceae bacterium]MDQ3164639.1 hypothetical protein [Actinomycetota bacterium]